MEAFLMSSVVKECVVAGGFARLESTGAILEMSQSLMYEMNVAPGCTALVCFADEHGQPVGVEQRFQFHERSARHLDACTKDDSLGRYCVECAVWPSGVLKKNHVLCNKMAKELLGTPVLQGVDPGRLLVIFRGENQYAVQEEFKVDIMICALQGARRESTHSVETSTGQQQRTPGSGKQQVTPPIKKKGIGNSNNKFVAMSPSMRKSLQQNVSTAASSTPPPVKDQTVAESVEPVRNMNSVCNVLLSGGKRVKLILNSMLKRMLYGVRLMHGNVYPFWFLDVPLAACIIAPDYREGSFILPRHMTVDFSALSGGSSDGSGEERSSVQQFGYADDAVQAIVDVDGEDGPLARQVFKSAYTGYLSIQNVEGMTVGGMEGHVALLRKWISYPIKNYDSFRKQGVTPPTGVLLHGPPGTGKTLLARWVAHDAGAKLFVINGSELMSEYLGESEKCLAAIFRAARALSPSIIFIDEIDVLAPSRVHSQGLSKAASRLVATLAGELDSLYGYPVMVVGATNRKESLDESLRRPRRLEKEIEIGVPDPDARFEILDSLFLSIHNSLSPDDIHDVAMRAYGFVGADLRQLSSEASMIALRRCVKDGADAVVTRKDVEAALHHTKPSALREFSSDIPNVRLSDVGGNAELKQKLREAIEWPIKFKERLHSMGAVPPKGILLWGPPGCSKTLLVKAMAGECRLNFFSVKGPELISKYVGESEKSISNIFEKARKASPAILFFDEIDGLVGARSKKASDGVDVSERVLSQMLQEMDGIKGQDDQVVVIGATNRMDRLDRALLRPGRFDRILQVCLPDENDRKEILNIHLRHIPLDDTVHMESLVKATEGCSGAEIASICQQAAMHALTSAVMDTPCTHVSQKDFDAVTMNATIKSHL